MPKAKLQPDDFILPLFVREGLKGREPVTAMPGVYRYSPTAAALAVEEALRAGVNRVLLFGVASVKRTDGRSAWDENNIVSRSVRFLKQRFPSLVVMTDVCLCAYTTHGHCGILSVASGNQDVCIDQKKTRLALAKMALTFARSGADWVAPSAMLPRQVGAIRKTLDQNNLRRVKILGYSAKFASNFYGPFRLAALSAPAFGDRRSYQADCMDRDAALQEIAADIREGADMVMVKPALSYLDVILAAKQKFAVPLAAYSTSGEYSLAKTLGVKKFGSDEKAIALEILSSIKRAGADTIITYNAVRAARWLKEGKGSR